MTNISKNNTARSAIALSNPKSPANLGAILRAAGCFGIDSILYTGTRIEYAQKFHTDTHNARESINLSRVDELTALKQLNLPIVCIELTENAIPLTDFSHPEEAIYLFGPEDGTVSQEAIDMADHVVYVPTYQCLNLAATVNITLYDRMQKLQTIETSNALILKARDQNNRTKKAAE